MPDPRFAYVVGAVKIRYEDRDVAHSVITPDDDRGYFNVIGADDDLDSDSRLEIGENVTYRVELTEAEAAQFATASNCRYVELDTEDVIDVGPASSPAASSMRFMRADFARVDVYHGRDVLIGILDSGTTAAVRNFLGVTMVARKVFADDDPGSAEVNGHHGSLVAACALPAGGKFLDAVTVNRNGTNPISAAAAGARWCADNGVKVVNYSASGPSPSAAWQDGLQYLADRDVQFFGSAGNTGLNEIRYPSGYSATFPNVHSSIAFDENTGARSTFSTYTSTASGCAPGTKVLGLTTAGELVTWDGTSASTPHMARLCAMGATGGRFTAAQVGAALKANTRDTGQPDAEQGGGAYDLEAALTALGGFTNLPTQALRRNLNPNPSIETNTTGYAVARTRDGVTASLALSNTITTPFGAKYLAANVFGDGTDNTELDVEVKLPDATVTAGLPYTFSVHSRHSVELASMWLTLRWRNNAGAELGKVVGPTTTLFATVWTRYHLTATAPPNATRVEVWASGLGFIDATFRAWRLDGVHYEQTGTLKPYFDGSTAGGAWTGAAHNSTSTIGVDSGTGSPQTQNLGVGGIAAPAAGPNVVLVTADRATKLTITTSNKVYDGGGHTVTGGIEIAADNVTVQNFRVNAQQQYGIYSSGTGNTIQNNDIKGLTPTGDGDLNAITFFGNDTKIRFNTAIDFVSGSPGGSHTDFIQTWVSTAHPVNSSNILIQGNKATGPANPARSTSIASIHQCVMAEGFGRGGNTGGSSTDPHDWLIADNEFGGSWNQEIKLDGIDNVSVTRNRFVGSSDTIMSVSAASTGFKYYNDNVVTGSYGSVGATAIPGPGPGAIVGGGTGTPSNDADAVLIIKAPTGTNTITGNRVFTTTTAAGLTLSGGAWRKTGFGPQLVMLERANVGIAGDPNETDGTGLSITGVPGDTGTTPGTGGGGGTGSADNPGDLLKVGLDVGFSKANIGIGFLKGDPLDRDGDGHVDFTLAEIGNGLEVPAHFEMTPDNQRVRLTVPASAGTTSSGTANPRTEFRELKQAGDGSSSHPKAAWDPTRNDHKCFTRDRVIRAPAQKPQLVMIQTHDAADDTSMLRYHGGKLQCRIGDTVLSIGDITWNLNSDYDKGIQVTAGKVRFWFGPVGSPVVVYEGNFGWTTPQYFKWGNYLQANETNVDPDEYSVTEMTSCMCWHTGDPEPAVHLG